MIKKRKKGDINLNYINYGQVQKKNKSDRVEKRKRRKEDRTIKEKDYDIETVIQMTNKDKIKKKEEERRKLSKEEEKRKKKNRKRKGILKILILLGIIVGGIAFAMISPIFNIQEIQVVNNEQVSKETIISLSGLKRGENIFRFSIYKVVDHIKENAYIENVKIHREIPNTVKIEVEEREHSYSIDFLGKYAYINSQGYILEIMADSKEKIVIKGIQTPEKEVIVGNRLKDEDLEKLEDVIKMIKVAKEYNIENKITSIDISDKNEYSLYLQEEEKKIYLGDSSNLSNKMLYVNAIIEKEKGKPGEIFANGDFNNKFRVYFRESLNV